MNLPGPDAPLCSSGKRPFRTEEEADRALRAAQTLRRNGSQQRVPTHVEQKAYLCHVCSWWHLASSKGPRRRGELGNRGRRQPRRR